jgi:hypothetical protein
MLKWSMQIKVKPPIFFFSLGSQVLIEVLRTCLMGFSFSVKLVWWVRSVHFLVWFKKYHWISIGLVGKSWLHQFWSIQFYEQYLFTFLLLGWQVRDGLHTCHPLGCFLDFLGHFRLKSHCRTNLLIKFFWDW